MGKPGPELGLLRIAQCRRRGVVQHAIQQAIGEFEPLARRELFELLQKGRLVHEDKVRFASEFSILLRSAISSSLGARHYTHLILRSRA
jgi:hypothetical protein